MKRMIAGVEGGGPFKGRRFQMEATPEEAAAAKPYLKYDLDQKALFYASRTANTGFMDNRERPSAMPVTSDTPAAATARRNAELFCAVFNACLLNTSDAADDLTRAHRGGRPARQIKKTKKHINHNIKEK